MMVAEVEGGSLESRPDAVSRDYQRSWSRGPVAVSDASEGYFTYTWQVRVDGHDVFLARENEDRTAWQTEELRFSYEGLPIIEIDLAFEQNGNVVICAERATGVGGTPQVWLYWFNPFAGEFTFELIADGKTPRLLLDDPFSPSESDILLFYLNTTNQRVEFRVQRELYRESHIIPVDTWYDLETGVNVIQTNTENMFLEEVARTRNYRLVVVASLRNPVTGQYSLLLSESAPYPVRPDDSFVTEHELLDAELIVYVIAEEQLESFSTDHIITGVELSELVLFIGERENWPVDGWFDNKEDSFSTEQKVLSASVEDLVIKLQLPAENNFTTAQKIDSVSVSLFVIALPLQGRDGFNIEQTIQNVSLVSI